MLPTPRRTDACPLHKMRPADLSPLHDPGPGRSPLSGVRRRGGARVPERPGSQDGGRGALHVDDQGSGIASARLPALFDSFTSTKRTGAHVGMGLPNVRRIAVAHGGNVTVKSEENKGSEFTITLPLQSPEA